MKKEHKERQVAWLCNGKDPKCKGKQGCYYAIHNGIRGACSHTRDSRYAIHKKLNPRDNPEMFDRFESEENIRYYERDNAK